MSVTQPMGRGFGPGRFEEGNREAEAKESIAKVKQAIHQVGQLETMLAMDPTLKALADSMEATMKEAYLATEKGKVQMEIAKSLRSEVEIDISLLARNLRKKLMGSKLTSLIEE
jgi:hypothetical protein